MVIFYDAAGTLVATQAEAKNLDKNFTKIDIPTDKEGLLTWINHERWRLTPYGQPNELEPYGEAGRDQLAVEGSSPSPPQPFLGQTMVDEGGAAEMAQALSETSIEDQILTLDGAEFGRVLTATLDRLGELKTEGWDMVRAFAKMHKSRGNLERAIGYLFLEAKPHEE